MLRSLHNMELDVEGRVVGRTTRLVFEFHERFPAEGESSGNYELSWRCPDMDQDVDRFIPRRKSVKIQFPCPLPDALPNALPRE
jgi:hypothetical protein